MSQAICWAWFRESPKEHVENELLDKAIHGARPLKVTSISGNTAFIEYKGEQGQVTTNGLLERPIPEFEWGEKAYITKRDLVGRIVDVCWHFKMHRYYYYLDDLNGKDLKKRYFAEDLERI